MHVLALSGSSSSTSIHERLLRYAASLLPGDATVDVVRTTEFADLPLYSIDREQSGVFPESAKELHQKLQACDALILACPEHNGYPPAMFKNVLDWASRVEPGAKWVNTRVLLLSTSPGPGAGERNLLHLAGKMPWWGSEVIGTYSLPSFSKNFEEASITDSAQAKRLQGMIDSLVAAVNKS